MSSTLEHMVSDYLQVRRSMGYKLTNAEYILGQFVAYLHDHDTETVTVEHALGFAMAPQDKSRRWQALRLSAVRFARWAHCLDPEIEVPPARLLPARPTRVAPFIYSADQIQDLLGAAGELHPAMRAATYRTLIALMAATGIRTGEVIGLDIDHFDAVAQTLTVTGKYDKIRMLPLHPTVVDGLTDYLARRERLLPATACPALLISTRGTRLHPSTVHQVFSGLRAHAGLGPVSAKCRPRLHDLRHTFAVSTMLDAYRSGGNPAEVLPLLSTWMGHSEPSDTYWYLSGTAELMAAATQRLESRFDDLGAQPS
ncbi:tyrosine-type recombinase/integrase [Rhodococcus qingshengii]|nr:tyrosine-type recombinase/integrase [Rhodococcus qingshengii]